MTDRRCIFCGRLIEMDRYALFRMPPDSGSRPDKVFRRYLESRGTPEISSVLPDICGIGSPEMKTIDHSGNRPVLMTRTGRSTDTLICPSCHNPLYRSTEEGSVESAVFFGGKGSGKTSLILSLAVDCIERQFSPDDRYRYFFNSMIYSEEAVKNGALECRSGKAPEDLRSPVAVYRTTRASDGGRTVCDVMHDVSASDTADMQSVGTALTFAESSGQFVYCLPAQVLEKAAAERDMRVMLNVKTDIFAMLCACEYSAVPPVLHITVTKLDTASEDIMKLHRNETSLKGYIYSAFECFGETERFFTGVRVHAVSAAVPELGGDDLTGRLYTDLFDASPANAAVCP